MEKISKTKSYEHIINRKETVFIYFSSRSCGVCDVMKIRIEALLEQYPEISAYEVSIEKFPEIGAQNQIFSVPAFFLYHQGKELMRQAGFLRLDHLKKLLEQRKS